jgi:hypothetical protein
MAPDRPSAPSHVGPDRHPSPGAIGLSSHPAAGLSRYLEAGVLAVMSCRWTVRQRVAMNAYSRAELARWRKNEKKLEVGLSPETRKRLDELRMQDARLLRAFTIRAADVGARPSSRDDRPGQFIPGNW